MPLWTMSRPGDVRVPGRFGSRWGHSRARRRARRDPASTEEWSVPGEQGVGLPPSQRLRYDWPPGAEPAPEQQRDTGHDAHTAQKQQGPDGSRPQGGAEAAADRTRGPAPASLRARGKRPAAARPAAAPGTTEAALVRKRQQLLAMDDWTGAKALASLPPPPPAMPFPRHDADAPAWRWGDDAGDDAGAGGPSPQRRAQDTYSVQRCAPGWWSPAWTPATPTRRARSPAAGRSPPRGDPPAGSPRRLWSSRRTTPSRLSAVAGGLSDAEPEETEHAPGEDTDHGMLDRPATPDDFSDAPPDAALPGEAATPARPAPHAPPRMTAAEAGACAAGPLGASRVSVRHIPDGDDADDPIEDSDGSDAAVWRRRRARPRYEKDSKM